MQRHKISRRVALTSAGLATALAAVSCSSSAPSPSVPGRALGHPNLQLVSALDRFSSCDDVLSNFKTEASRRVTANGLPGSSFGMEGDLMTADAARGAAPLASPSAPTTNKSASPAGGVGGAEATPAHSDTNVQEKGVDEPDTTKTDGKRLYTVTNNTLYVFAVDNGIPTQTGTLALSGVNDHQLLLAGDKLLVVTKAATYRGGPIETETATGAYVQPGGPPTGTELLEVDASDPAHPKASSQINIDGSVVDARLVDGTARIVISSSPAPLSFVQPTTYTTKGRQQAEDANHRIIDDSTLDDWLPSYSIAGSTDRRPLVECANVNHPKQFGGFGTVTVLTVQVGQGINPRNSVSVQADADKVYASANHLYVSTNRVPDPSDQSDGTTAGTAGSTGTVGSTAAAAPINGGIQCDPACPPPTTPVAPVPPTPRPTVPTPPDYHTAIHEFDISGSGPATYLASGEVRGHLLTDFAMSELNGYLRMATTDGPPWGATASGVESFVSVVHEDGGELKPVGQVGGMGKGEQIRSVRFIGSTGYVVTFRQTDPLYTVDVSNPSRPVVAGELPLLGYSAYLHPVGDGRLLGIGQDATSQGRTLGTQVTLFDVSNPTRPELLQKVTMPGAHSEVEQDYHAFGWWDPTHLALIPVQQYQAISSGAVPNCMPDSPCRGVVAPTPSSNFVGAIGMTVDPSGIHETGRIVNPSVTTPGGCPAGADCTVEPAGPSTTPTTADPGLSDSEVRRLCEASGQCATTTTAPPSLSTTTSSSTTSSTSVDGPPSTVIDCDPACPGPTSTTPAPGSSTTGSTTSPTSPPTSTTLRPVPEVPAGSGAPITRAVVVGDHVFTVSAGGILVSDLATLSPITWVPFT